MFNRQIVGPRVLINAQIAALCAYAAITLRRRIFTPTLTVAQKIALTAIVDQAHNNTFN
jgi:hypothetical protein